MNEGRTITAGFAKPAIRKMSYNELPNELLSSLRRCRVEAGSDPCEAVRRREQVGWVAEVQGRSAGFIVCAVVRPTGISHGPLLRLARLFGSLLARRSELPLYVELLDLVVAEPELAWEVVEDALLRRVVEELQRSWDRTPVVVPESNLAAQLILRDARYRAIRVMRGYYGEEDGYLMVQDQEPA